MNRRNLFAIGVGVAAAAVLGRTAIAAHATADPSYADAAAPATLHLHSVRAPNGGFRSHLLPFETFPDGESLGRALAEARSQHLFI
jgi:hypothetical protein